MILNLYALYLQQQVAVVDPSQQCKQSQGLKKDQGTQAEIHHAPRQSTAFFLFSQQPPSIDITSSAVESPKDHIPARDLKD